MANTTGKKFGGRQSGTPNKMTVEMRELLKIALQNEIEMIPVHFNKMEAKDRLELLVKLLPFVLPKVEQIDQQAKGAEYNSEIRDAFLESLRK